MGRKKGAKAAGIGFLLIDIDVVRQLYADDCGPDEMAAYFVLCSGQNWIDGLRCCTHGADSVARRCGMSRRRAATAIGWLAEHDYIRKPDVDEPKRVGPAEVRWIIKPGENDDDVPICRLFTDCIREGSRSPLARLLAEVNATEFSRCQTLKDVLLLFAAFSREQDYADFAGLDPRVWRESLPVTVAEDSIWSDWNSKHSKETGLVLVEVAKNGHRIEGDRDFIDCTTGLMSKSTTEADQRFWHATAELRRLGLLFPAVVIWSGDPLDGSTRHDAQPLATLYVEDKLARQHDSSIQFDVNKCLQRVVGEGDCEFDKDGSLSLQYDGYRYLVRRGDEGKVVVVRQFRVRYGGATPSNVEARRIEEGRTEQLRVLVSQF